MSAYKQRVGNFTSLLKEEAINLTTLQNLCSGGIPDEGGLRPLCWRLLLNFIPPQKLKWKEVLAHKRSQYKNFVQEIVIEASKPSKRSTPEVEDHPLNPSPDSQWRSFFDDNQVLAQIDKDVRRLCPDMVFFQRATAYPCLEIVGEGHERLHHRVTSQVLASAPVIRKGLGITKQLEMSRRSSTVENYQPLPIGSEAHWEVVERILFIYAKLNPGQSYVQGMNEIVGPLYYTFATDPDLEFREYAEADTFFCFMSLMGEVRDFFIRTLDQSSSGIGSMMNRLMMNLKHFDTQLFTHLESQQLKPEYFSFRWLTLLLSQEFDMPDVIQIWDFLFADPHRFNGLIQVCTAMLLLQRDTLINSDFATNVKLLQKYPPGDVRPIIKMATEVAEESHTKSLPNS